MVGGLRFFRERVLFAIFRNQKSSVIVFPAFCKVQLFAAGQIFIFCMPEKQIGDLKSLAQFAYIFHSAVMFFVGLEALPLTVETEGLMEKPLSALKIRKQMLLTGFVSWKNQREPLFGR